MDINLLLRSVLNTRSGGWFYRFANADGKIWLMPVQNMRVAMNLYQPSGRNGKIVKALFPWLHRIPFVRNAIHAQKLYYSMNDELKQLLGRLFYEAEPEFSIFCGTPCVHQKITMQISKERRILGYCKITDNEEIGAIFMKEKLLLDTLSEKGMNNIPQCLYCEKQDNGLILFIQTTTKSEHSIIENKWNKRKVLFLEELHDKTKQIISFEQTEFYHDLIFLQEHLNSLLTFDTTIIGDGIDFIMKFYQGKKVNFSFYHGDFTPWNMYVEKGELFVFDFEYAKQTYPPYLDFFHFITQVSAFEKHFSVKATWSLYQKTKKSMNSLIKDTDMAYICYLLSIIGHYVKRENGVFSNTISQNLKLWIELLKCLKHSLYQ